MSKKIKKTPNKIRLSHKWRMDDEDLQNYLKAKRRGGHTHKSKKNIIPRKAKYRKDLN